MSMPRGFLRLPYAEHATFDSDAELLQTDIMRFMALLGFVLMGIFALVQALPITPTKPRPEVEQRAQLRREIADLEHYIAKRRNVLTEFEASRRAAERRRQRFKHKTREAEQVLARVLARTRALQVAFEQSRAELARMQAEIQTERHSLLSALRADVERQRQKLRRLEKRFTALRQSTKEIQQRRHEASASKTPETKTARADEKVEPAATATQQAAPVPERGFTLKFKSGAAFDRLVARDAVEFYALIGKRAWHAEQVGRVIRFRASAPPRRYHEMAAATVPTAYVQSLRVAVASFGRDSVTWATVLPERMLAVIRERIAGKRSGDIIIGPEGDIHLENVMP